MNCQTIRETIDTAARRAGYSETVHTHLDGCADCRRHADGTSSLLALLNAQPRVEAPADFDFRLRARIARAQSEPQVATGLLANWLRSFSLGQAAAAMAAITVALTASSFYFTNPNEMATPGGVEMAVVKSPQSPADPAVAPVPSAVLPVRAAKSTIARTSNRSVRLQAIQPASSTTTIASAKVNARETELASFYANGQVVRTSLNRDLIGAEAASQKSQTALSF